INTDFIPPNNAPAILFTNPNCNFLINLVVNFPMKYTATKTPTNVIANDKRAIMPSSNSLSLNNCPPTQSENRSEQYNPATKPSNDAIDATKPLLKPWYKFQARYIPIKMSRIFMGVN